MLHAMTKDNLTYIGCPRPNKVKNVTVCRITLLEGRWKSEEECNKGDTRLEIKMDHSWGCPHVEKDLWYRECRWIV